MRAGKVFLSFSQEDSSVAARLTRALRDRDVEVWNSEDSIEFGESISAVLRNMISDSNLVVVLLSSDSVDSPGVLFEAGAAMGQDKDVVAVDLSRGARRQLPLGFEEAVRIPAGSKKPAQIADAIIRFLHKESESISSRVSPTMSELHVTPRSEGGWSVARSGARRASSVHARKAEAVRAARQRAKRQSGEVVIHNSLGKIVERSSYGDRSYYVNKNAQSNGDHEVHATSCSYMPDARNRVYLGTFPTCNSAVREAKKYYSQVNGCYYCANACHTH